MRVFPVSKSGNQGPQVGHDFEKIRRLVVLDDFLGLALSPSRALALMETCVYVVEFGQYGYPIKNANSRMPSVHDRIGYYPLPCESDCLVMDHIIFPDQDMAALQKNPIPFPVVYCLSGGVERAPRARPDFEVPCQSTRLSPEATHSAKLPASLPPEEEPPAVRDVSRSPAALTS